MDGLDSWSIVVIDYTANVRELDENHLVSVDGMKTTF